MEKIDKALEDSKRLSLDGASIMVSLTKEDLEAIAEALRQAHEQRRVPNYIKPNKQQKEKIKQETVRDILNGRDPMHRDVFYQIVSEAVNYMIYRGYIKITAQEGGGE